MVCALRRGLGRPRGKTKSKAFADGPTRGFEEQCWTRNRQEAKRSARPAPEEAAASAVLLPLPSPPVRTVGAARRSPPAGRPPALWRLLGALRNTGKVCFYTLAPLVLLAMMAVGILYVRLRHGPIAFDFIVPPIERGINAELTNNAVTIKGAELRLGRDNGLEFRLRDAIVLEPDGAVVLSSPTAAFSISKSALCAAASCRPASS